MCLHFHALLIYYSIINPTVILIKCLTYLLINTLNKICQQLFVRFSSEILLFLFNFLCLILIQDQQASWLLGSSVIFLFAEYLTHLGVGLFLFCIIFWVSTYLVYFCILVFCLCCMAKFKLFALKIIKQMNKRKKSNVHFFYNKKYYLSIWQCIS